MAFTIKTEDTAVSVIYYLNFVFNQQSINVGIELENNTPQLAYPYYSSLKVLHEDPNANKIKLIGFMSRGIFDKEARNLLADSGFSFEAIKPEEVDFFLKKETDFTMQDIECIAKIIESRLAVRGIFMP